jgi:hypothetical protein
MLLSDLKDTLFGPFDTTLESDNAVTTLATAVDELARNVARNLPER